ncbi:hypothetical protein ES705_24992 [subsurface metagenome]|nr:hypothetical protein [Methanosarcinales archaeon]
MEYEIIGDNLQMVVTKISSGEMVYGEAGAMIYMSDNMQMNAKAKGGFLKGIKRKLAGETFFTLWGPGHVILQSMTIANLAAALRPFMPSGTSGRSSSPLSIGGLPGDGNKKLGGDK